MLKIARGDYFANLAIVSFSFGGDYKWMSKSQNVLEEDQESILIQKNSQLRLMNISIWLKGDCHARK